MAYTKTTWFDRAVQFATRYLKSGETSSGVTLTADPGTVTQAGTPVNAANLNKLEQGVADAHTTADAAVKRNGDTMTGNLTAPNQYQQRTMPGTDLNAATDPGIYVLGVATTYANHPGGDYSLLEVHSASPSMGGYIVQRINPVLGNSGPYRRMRTDVSSGWTLWVREWDTSQLRTTNGYPEWNNAGTWQGVGGVKNVQRGVTNVVVTTVNVTIAPVASMAKASVNLLSVVWGTGSTNANGAYSAYLSATNNLVIEKSGGSVFGTAMDIRWEVIEYY